MMNKPLIFLLACLAGTANAAGHRTYCNQRFGFCADYPDSLTMAPQEESGEGGHGRNFADSNGFTMVLYGYNNVDESTLASTKKGDEELFDTITYRKQGSNWYALSGYQGDNILYVKSWVGVGAINRLSLDYPTRLKTTYDGDVNYIVRHFRPGDLAEMH
jgi:hypothetical protein